MKRFLDDERGNFAVIAALMTTLLVGALGGALDVSQQWTERSIIQRAADAASLAGAKALEYGTAADAQKSIQDAARANLPPGFRPVTFVGTIDEAAGTVSVSADASFKPNFLQLFSIDSLPVGGTSKSLIQRKSYIDFFLALDVSESMNIAASEEDRKKLEAYTGTTRSNYRPRPCAFACHHVEPEWAPISVYEMNEKVGARLRIDVLKSAADEMIDKVLDLNNQPGSLKSTRVATAGFSLTYEIGMGPAANASALKQSIRSFSNANNDTNMNEALAGFKRQLGTQGGGTSFSDSRKFAILITDGVHDTDRAGKRYGPLDPSLCSGIKNSGINLVVLEIKYVKDYDQYGFFKNRVSSYYDRISPSLNSCASPGYYYQATDADEAASALLQIVDDILTVRRRLAS